MSSYNPVNLGDLRTPFVSIFTCTNTKVTISLDPTFKGLSQLEDRLRNIAKGHFMDVELPIQKRLEGPPGVEILCKPPFWAKIRATPVPGQTYYNYYLLHESP